MATIFMNDPVRSFSSVNFIENIKLQKQKQQIFPIQLYLENEWVFFYDRYPGPGLSVEEYMASVKQIGSVNTVQKFWNYFNNLPPVEKLGPRTSYHLMKKGILPLWEDPANEKGGHLAIKVSRRDSDRTWLYALLAVIGEQLIAITKEPDEICGVSVSIRKTEAIISIWNSRAEMVNLKMLEQCVRYLLPGIQIQEFSYKVHRQEEHFMQGFVPSQESRKSPHC